MGYVVAHAIALQGVVASTFNGDPKMIASFREAVAATLSVPETDVLHILASDDNNRRRRLPNRRVLPDDDDEGSSGNAGSAGSSSGCRVTYDVQVASNSDAPAEEKASMEAQMTTKMADSAVFTSHLQTKMRANGVVSTSPDAISTDTTATSPSVVVPFDKTCGKKVAGGSVVACGGAGLKAKAGTTPCSSCIDDGTECCTAAGTSTTDTTTNTVDGGGGGGAGPNENQDDNNQDKDVSASSPTIDDNLLSPALIAIVVVAVAGVLGAVVFVVLRANRHNKGGSTKLKEEQNDIELSHLPTQKEYSNPMEKDGKKAWTTHKDDDGNAYYEDQESGRTTWTQRNSDGVAVALDSSGN